MFLILAHFGLDLVQVLFYVTILSISLWILWKLLPRGKIEHFGSKYILITGCDSGFGKETAIRLDQMGFHVFATCLTEQGEESLSAVCSDKLKTLHLDVTKPEMIREVYTQVNDTIPSGTGLWALINNAGIMISAPIEWLSMKHFKRQADINLWGLIDVTKVFLPLVKQARGRVINISSMAGRVSLPTYASYNITKYGVEAFSDALRREMRPLEVKVAIIEPVGFKTPIHDPSTHERQLKEMWNDLSDELKEDYGSDSLEILIKKKVDVYKSGVSPQTHKVVDAVVDAVTSLSPLSRYIVGDWILYVVLSITVMPTAVGDMFARSFVSQIDPKSNRKN